MVNNKLYEQDKILSPRRFGGHCVLANGHLYMSFKFQDNHFQILYCVVIILIPGSIFIVFVFKHISNYNSYILKDSIGTMTKRDAYTIMHGASGIM